MNSMATTFSAFLNILLHFMAKEGNREIKMLCAVEYLSMDLVEKAEEIFKEMLSQPDADVYNGLGICARRKGLYNDAIQYFMKAIEHGEVEVSSTNICDIYEELGEFEREENFLKDMVQKYENGYLNAIYARALLIIGKHEEAEEFARKAIQLGEEMEGYLQLAFALIMQRKNEEAEKTLIEMKNKFPDKLQPYILLANIYMDKEEEKAKEYLDEIYQKSRDPYVMEYLAMSYMSIGEEEKAEKVLKEAIMLHNLPNFHLIYGAFSTKSIERYSTAQSIFISLFPSLAKSFKKSIYNSGFAIFISSITAFCCCFISSSIFNSSSFISS